MLSIEGLAKKIEPCLTFRPNPDLKHYLKSKRKVILVPHLTQVLPKLLKSWWAKTTISWSLIIWNPCWTWQGSLPCKLSHQRPSVKGLVVFLHCEVWRWSGPWDPEQACPFACSGSHLLPSSFSISVSFLVHPCFSSPCLRVLSSSCVLSYLFLLFSSFSSALLWT